MECVCELGTGFTWLLVKRVKVVVEAGEGYNVESSLGEIRDHIDAK